MLSRSSENGCPFCSGKKAIVGETDLATIRPDLVSEWDFEKNKNLKPTEVTSGSGKKIWWKCKRGHSWEATIISRTRLLKSKKCICYKSEGDYI